MPKNADTKKRSSSKKKKSSSVVSSSSPEVVETNASRRSTQVAQSELASDDDSDFFEIIESPLAKMSAEKASSFKTSSKTESKDAKKANQKTTTKFVPKDDDDESGSERAISLSLSQTRNSGSASGSEGDDESSETSPPKKKRTDTKKKAKDNDKGGKIAPASLSQRKKRDRNGNKSNEDLAGPSAKKLKGELAVQAKNNSSAPDPDICSSKGKSQKSRSDKPISFNVEDAPELPAIDSPATHEEIESIARRIDFEAVLSSNDEDNDRTTRKHDEPISAKRTIKPSAKALAMLEALDKLCDEASDDTLPPIRDILKRAKSSVNSDTKEKTTKSDQALVKRGKSKRRRESPTQTSDLKSSPASAPTVAKKSRTDENVASDAESVPIEWEPTDDEKEIKSKKSKQGERKEATEPKKKVNKDLDAVPDVLVFTTRKDVVSCNLKTFISAATAAKNNGETVLQDSSLPYFGALLDLLHTDVQKSNLLDAHNFVKKDCFLNPARAKLTDATIAAFRAVCPSNTDRQMVFISTGWATSCHLQESTTNGYGTNEHQIKKINVMVVYKEFDRAISFVGSLYNTKELYAHYINDKLSFQTVRKDPPGGKKAFRSDSKSPVKKSSKIFATRSGGSDGPSYPAVLQFTDTVPIYDIRKTRFRFSRGELGSINKLPLYRMGLSDLPDNCIVSVGYTVNTFKYQIQEREGQNGINSSALSPNIQFVLYHGQIDPKEIAAMNDEVHPGSNSGSEADNEEEEDDED